MQSKICLTPAAGQSKLTKLCEGEITIVPADSTSSKSTSVTVKHNRKLKLVRVDEMLDPTISIHSKTEDDLDEWSKDFCIKTLITGVIKLVSNQPNLAFYESVVVGVKSYPDTVL